MTVVNLQAFSLSFWQDYKSGTGSFAILSTSISNLHCLKYLSLSQAILYPEHYDVMTDEMNDSVFQRLAAGCPGLLDLHLGSFYAVTTLTWEVIIIAMCIMFISFRVSQRFAQNFPMLRSLSIEDCGVSLGLPDINIFMNMARSHLQYLTIIPRSLGNSSRYLPSPAGPYIEDDALTALSAFVRSGVSPLQLFVKKAVNTSVVGSAEMYIDDNIVARKKYDYLVSTGHIAALRMYDEKQLLPLSYFSECDS